jgi:hypothetical protein
VDGKRNPVTLVSAVVKRKGAVVTGNLFEANIPPTTISPLPMATRVIATCNTMMMFIAGVSGYSAATDNLTTLLPASKVTWLLIVTGVSTLAFALSAFTCDRLGYKIVSPFLAAGAWLFSAFAVLLWFWQ